MDIRNITKVYNNAIGNAIVRKGIPHFRILKKSSTFQVGLGYKQKRFIYDDINSSTARRICNNKSFTKYFLEQLDIPVPHGEKIKTILELEKAFKKLSKPVVIKPVSEMWGKGISTNIKTLQEAKKAYKIARSFKGSYVIIEEHILGDDHRILYIGGQYIAGLKRTPPCIIGDGKNTIENLIKNENLKRKKSNRIVKEILIDEPVLNFLKIQGLSMKSILPKEKKIKIRMTGNICSGGISENITDKVHPSIIKLGEEIISYLDLEIGGIDILTTDISRPLSETSGKISEINQNPDIVMHTKPYLGKPRDTAGLFIDYLFPSEKNAWIKIKRGRKTIKSQKELNKYLHIVPKKVICIQKNSLKKIIIHNPDKALFNYLISNLTYSINI